MNSNSKYITSHGKSNLWYSSKHLKKSKRKIFYAFYASFRILDNYIEKSHIDDRVQGLDLWKHVCLQAYDNVECISIPDGSWLEEHHSVIQNLKRAFKSTKIKKQPWIDMHEAMSLELEYENNTKNLETWEDFEEYSKGAADAPAYIYLYLLFSRRVAGKYKYDNVSTLKDLSVSFGRYCYLIHILRDLIIDAYTGTSLILIPEIDVLQDAGISKLEIHKYAKRKFKNKPVYPRETKLITYVIELLLEKAHKYHKNAQESLEEIEPNLNLKGWQALLGLYSVYEYTHEQIKTKKKKVLKFKPIVSPKKRKRIILDPLNIQQNHDCNQLTHCHDLPASNQCSVDVFSQEASYLISRSLKTLIDSIKLFPLAKNIYSEHNPSSNILGILESSSLDLDSLLKNTDLIKLLIENPQLAKIVTQNPDLLKKIMQRPDLLSLILSVVKKDSGLEYDSTKIMSLLNRNNTKKKSKSHLKFDSY